MATVPSTQSFVAGEKVTASKLNASSKTVLDFLMNPPRVNAYLGGTLQPASGTSTLVTFDSEAWDTDSMHSTSSNTSRITINTSGQYLVSFYARFPSNATGYRQANLRQNSAGAANGGSSLSTVSVAAANGAATFVGRTFELTCVAGDHYELFVTQNSGSTLTMDSGQRVTAMEFRWLGS
ncbi:hypothetical protein ACIF83_10205 [Streptomyces sp. NPDC085866]|uniref:hypothetical protein n=1 Tax=Streptomyces sp. NPDC085866 TaxID=3365736 RepID=UPI0037D09B7C